jgi:phosphoribosyl-AMP cyclohydrolase
MDNIDELKNKAIQFDYKTPSEDEILFLHDHLQMIPMINQEFKSRLILENSYFNEEVAKNRADMLSLLKSIRILPLARKLDILYKIFIENKKLESGYNNGYQGLVTTLKNSAILGTKFSLLNNKCTLVHIDYKNNLSGDGTYCGILPHNYFVIGRKLYYGHYPSKVEERPAFLVGDLATSTEMKVLYSDDEGESYIIFNNKVLLNGKEIIGTNPRNFQVKPTSRAYRARANYSNDDTKVFYNGIVIPSADASSFDVSLSNGEVHLYYGRDKNNIYYKGEVVKGADPLSFKSFSVDSYESPRAVPYGVDSRYVYYATTTIHEADVTTFKALDWCAFEDKVHVFDLHGGLISNADPKTYKCPIMGL